MKARTSNGVADEDGDHGLDNVSAHADRSANLHSKGNLHATATDFVSMSHLLSAGDSNSCCCQDHPLAAQSSGNSTLMARETCQVRVSCTRRRKARTWHVVQSSFDDSEIKRAKKGVSMCLSWLKSFGLTRNMLAMT